MIITSHFTSKGPRSNNEDSLEIKETSDHSILCIADGVGGEHCGKLASEKAIDFLIAQISSFDTDLVQCIKTTHEQIKLLQRENLECGNMATTLTMCIINDFQLKGVHVGDSRLCVLRGNGIKQLTESHTEVFRLAKAGKIKLRDIENYSRKNVIESAIGINSELTIDTFEFTLQKGDRFLLTTDGVHEIINKKEFRDFSRDSKTIQDFADKISSQLNHRKLTDNATFIVAEMI